MITWEQLKTKPDFCIYIHTHTRWTHLGTVACRSFWVWVYFRYLWEQCKLWPSEGWNLPRYFHSLFPIPLFFQFDLQYNPQFLQTLLASKFLKKRSNRKKRKKINSLYCLFPVLEHFRGKEKKVKTFSNHTIRLLRIYIKFHHCFFFTHCRIITCTL